MSDRGIPRSFRHMHGFGSHTYSFFNARNERFWVKFTLRTMQGIENLTDADAQYVAGRDRESNQRALFDSIERGDIPRWAVYVQIMPAIEAATYHLNPFDLTKVWPHGDYPLLEVGVLELNRNPENFFAQIEQVAFNPATIVPGIGFSPDKMLQARLFSYGDAQRYRLGTNYSLIPVNAPKCPVHTFHRDGQMRVDDNRGRATSYQPNGYNEWVEQPDFAEPSLPIDGSADHWNHRTDTDYYSQPRALFQLMTQTQRQALFDNTARSIKGAAAPVVARHVDNCTKAHPDYGAGVAESIARLANSADAASRAGSAITPEFGETG